MRRGRTEQDVLDDCLPTAQGNDDSFICFGFESAALTADSVSSAVSTVRDCPVPELQCAPAEEG